MVSKKQRIIEMGMCFMEQFAKGKIPNSEKERMLKYNKIMYYLDYLFENYEKMGILK